MENKGFIKEIEINDVDRKSLQKLASNRDFQRLKNVVESFQQKRSYNLIAGNVDDKSLLSDELKEYRGAFKLWTKITNLIYKEDENN
jgi:hypothetical protein